MISNNCCRFFILHYPANPEKFKKRDKNKPEKDKQVNSQVYIENNCPYQSTAPGVIFKSIDKQKKQGKNCNKIYASAKYLVNIILADKAVQLFYEYVIVVLHTYLLLA
jgi:hypothetical protein